MVTKTGTSKNDTLRGTDNADTLKGLDGDDQISGFGGNDKLFGGNGNDTLKGGFGNDTIDPGMGDDTIDGGGGSDTITFASATTYVSFNLGYTSSQYTPLGTKTVTNVENVIGSSAGDYLSGNVSANRLDGGDGDDTLYGYDGNDRLFGGAGNDSLYAGEGKDTLDGGSGNDSLDGGNGDDTLDGGSGDDKLYGGYGIDTLRGGVGNDNLSGGEDNDKLYGGSGDDTLDGGGGDDRLYGESGDDTLAGGYGNDTLEGGDGNDTLDGGSGNDTVKGGAGNDVFTVSYGTDTFDGGSGSDTVSFANAYVYPGIVLTLSPTTTWSSGTSYNIVLKSVENVTGSSYGDQLTGDNGNNILDGAGGADTLNGGNGNDTLIGGDGDDVLNGGAGSDSASYATAAVSVTVDLAKVGPQATGVGNDTLTSIENLIGSANDDDLRGNSGANVFTGGLGDDYMDGRAGSDTASYAGTSGAVSVNLSRTTTQNTRSAGYDRLVSIENLTGSSYDDVLTGSNGSNTLNGGAGSDRLQGLKGDDILNGGSGFDIASYTEVTSALTLSLAKTTAQSAGSAGKDRLLSIEGLEGGSGHDRLTGSNASNLLVGNKGNDRLSGAGGNDVLRGGAGNDTLDGGTGRDTADYSDIASAVTIDLNKKSAQDTKGAGKDTLTAIENVTGSSASDKLSGTSYANTLIGGKGNDKLYGRGGTDVLVGGDGNDTLDAGGGTGERLVGGAGNDRYMLGTGKGSGIIEDSLGDHDIIDASKSSSSATIDLATGKSSTSGGQKLTLAAGGTSTLPLDLVFLQDLSGSFGDDIATVRDLVPKVIDTVQKVNNDSAFGAVGFIDKPVSPFGSTGDYVYKLFSAVGKDESAIVDAYTSMSIQSGNDLPEAQIEALFQVAKRANGEVGFRGDSMRVVVLFTDAEYHIAGDGKTGGITKPNDGDATIESNGLGEDYPTLTQLRTALAKSGIFPIFAVSDGVSASYKTLVGDLGFGGVVALDDGSTNVVNAIQNAAKLATRTSIEDALGSKYSDVIKGSSIDNVIRGGAGNDKLTGLLGNDTLKGESGNDKLTGDAGADDLYGGSGKDTFIFKSIKDSTVSSAGRDSIFDFDGKGGDRIDLKAIDAKSGTSGNDAFTFIGTDTFNKKAGELRYDKKASDTYVYADTNGDGKTDFAIHLDDPLTLSKGYFLL